MALVSVFQPPLSIIFSSGIFLSNRSSASPTLNEWSDSSPILFSPASLMARSNMVFFGLLDAHQSDGALGQL